MKTVLQLFLPVIMASSAVFWNGCRNGEAATEKAIEEPKATADKVRFDQQDPLLRSVAVQSAENSKGPVLRLPGRVVWDDNVTVRIFSPFAGRVVKILVEAGQRVEENQPLALIASPDYGQAQAEYRKAVTDFALAEKNLNRLKELAEHGAAPTKDLQATESDYSRAESELQRTSARLVFYGGSTNSVDQLYCLRSPLSGVVIEKSINPGQEVRPDQMLASAPQLFAPLFLVSDPSKLWVVMDATERELHFIRAGQEALIRSSAYPDQTYAGLIDFVSDSLDAYTRTVKVRAKVPNPNRALKGEMLVMVEIPQKLGAGVQVPASAVFLKGDEHYVFVQAGPGEFQKKQVKLGHQTEKDVVLLDGVQQGDKVVTAGTLFLDQFLTLKGS
jgi:cobalt-zinc-cadmium efflux system membrane fusion protein